MAVKEHTCEQLNEILGDLVVNFRPGERQTFTHPAPFLEADKDALTFCTYKNVKLIEFVKQCSAAVLICNADANLDADLDAGLKHESSLVFVTEPRLAFIRAVTAYFAPRISRGIHPTAVIAVGAKVHETASIGPYTVVDSECEVGRDSVLHAHIHLYPKTRLGAGVVVHSGTVIGADGFGYARSGEGDVDKFPHLGGVRIEDDVEIGSNTSIDRGTLADTVIRRGAKVDNQVHIAHNADIGEGAFVIAQSLVAGSCTVGARSWISPSSALMNGVSVGDDAVVGLGAIVLRSVEPQTTVVGNPARLLQKKR